MRNVPLPNIPGETINSYRRRLAGDVAQCRCGCKFVMNDMREALTYIANDGLAGRTSKEKLEDATTLAQRVLTKWPA
jgi:hypothetical protein